MEPNLLIRQEEVGAKGEYDFSSRWMDIVFWDIMEPNEVVLEPNEVLLKRPAVEGSWIWEHPDYCLLSFHSTYSSMGYFWPCTANQQNRFFVVDLGSGKHHLVGRERHTEYTRTNKASTSKELEQECM
jgi:hypothetical protein